MVMCLAVNTKYTEVKMTYLMHMTICTLPQWHFPQQPDIQLKI